MKINKRLGWSMRMVAALMLTQMNVQGQLHRNSAWVGNYNTIRVTEKLSFSMDLQLRSADHWEHPETIMIRPAINYTLNSSVSAGGGVAFNRLWREVDGVRAGISDNRIYQQVAHTRRGARSSLQNRIRLEERWITSYSLVNNQVKKNNPHFNGRFRHSIKFTRPLAKQPVPANGFYLTLQNELFANAIGAGFSNGKVFDQTRAYSGLGYRLNKHVDVEGGYLFIYAAGRAKEYTINNVTQMILYIRI